MGKQFWRRAGASVLAVAGVGAATVAGGGAVAQAQPAPTSTTVTCSSANPLAWAPSFTWTIRASSGASLPPGGDSLVPSLLLSGNNELPDPPGGLFPSIGPNWYGTRVLVDWTNRNTGESGRSVSDEEAWKQKPSIPVNRTFAGTGTVDFTVTVQTGAAWWFVNHQDAVCQGTVEIVDA
ncbi:hypothetical protein [Rhodococcus sp. HNM0569]|uniref:hypothetical protein n=1 Tax=Rhodococcus sp. HNM0569 TaxID=2716340 RepID=UPI00146D3A74|nr:hypothetical protein [Rhodococcus sp. HNM0569]NLU84993.1 hypothetical protein [Rhodococcus sp. HNM0569]